MTSDSGIERPKPARWRKQKRPEGLAGVAAGEMGIDLVRDGKWIIHVRKLATGEWFWYGLGNNTASRPMPTMQSAKDEAMAFFKVYEAGEKLR